MLSYRFVAAMLLSLSVLLSSCDWESPEIAAQEWFNAAVETRGAGMLARTCEAKKQEVMEFGQGATVFKLGVGLLMEMFGLSIPVEVDASDVVFITVWSSDEHAEVKVQGAIYVAMMGFAQEIPLDESWLMVKERGSWKWCGPFLTDQQAAQ